MESARGLIAESSEGPGVATPSYIYSPLSEDGNIRLLRLLPNQDYHAPIQCEIFEYPLRKLNRGPHLYEALSYVWGSEENQQPIWIQSNRCSNGSTTPVTNNSSRLSVTWNLHVALLHLRNPFFDRILWVDAICINQDPAEREKGHQVQMMADIYANANRVVVWLGEASADSDIAFDALKGAARGKFMKLDVDTPVEDEDEDSALGDDSKEGDVEESQYYSSEYSEREGTEDTDSEEEEEDLEDVQKKAPGESLEERRAVFAVLERPWFQRIWVVQEVGVARRILMKCGSSELEGFVFCSGLSAMNLPYDTHPDLQALILPITNLIRDEIFRPPQDSGQQVASSLRTHTLAELVDLYHTRKAAKCVDKIYALLSISSDFSDNPEQSGLLVDYQASQDAVLESFTRLSLSPEMSVRVWDESGFAVIQGPGHILGRITEVKQGHSRDDVQNIVITWGKTALLSKRSGKDLTASRHQLQVTAKLVCEGDLVCLAKGGARPLIIRLFDNHAAIIRILTPIESGSQLAGPLPLISGLPTLNFVLGASPIKFTLIWDWNATQHEPDSQDSRPNLPERSNQPQFYMETVVSLLDFGILLNEAEDFAKSYKAFSRALEVYTRAAETMDANSNHSLKGTENGLAARVMDELAAGGGFSAVGWNDQSAVHWATDHGFPEFVDLLAKRGMCLEHGVTNGNTPLFKAAKTGNAAVVQILLDNGASPRNTKCKGRLLLWLAVEGEHWEVVDILLKGGADIETQDEYGDTLFFRAVKQYNKSLAILLLDKGACIDGRIGGDRTPLHYVSAFGEESVAHFLLERGANTEVRDSFGYTPLSLAVECGRLEMVELLLNAHADIEARDTNGFTPLLMAVGWTEDMARLLLDKGADIEGRDNKKRTALFEAARQGQLGLARLFLERGADIEARDEEGRTPLWEAVGEGNTKAVSLLLDSGASIEVEDSLKLAVLRWAERDLSPYEIIRTLQLLEERCANAERMFSSAREGQRALWEAVRQQRLFLIALLLVRGVGIEVKDESGHTALWLAGERRDYGVTKLLLVGGADITAMECQARVGLLRLAANKMNGHLVSLLLEGGVDIDAKDEAGRTALFWAGQELKKEVLILLLERGADVKKMDRGGEDVLIWAATNGHVSLVELLLDGGVDINAEGQNRRTALWWAEEMRHKSVIKMLLERGANVKTMSNGGVDELVWATKRGIEDRVKLLLDLGVEIKAKDREQRTALWWAEACGLQGIKALLLERGFEGNGGASNVRGEEDARKSGSGSSGEK